MKNSFKVAVLVTGLLVSVFANASTKSLGTLTSNDRSSITRTVGNSSSFTDVYNFTLSSDKTYDLVFDFGASNYKTTGSRSGTFAYNLYSGTSVTSGTALTSCTTSCFSTNLSVTEFAAGNYSLVLSGKGEKSDSKYLTTSLGITSHTIPPIVGSVPEPETYAMLLAGLGLMGAISRRRKAKQG
jgi:hypothetical protein